MQGPPTSSSDFSYTIHDKVKEADRKLAEHGGCARFGMDDGYMIGPKEVICGVLAEFAEDIQQDHECILNTRKCRMYCLTEGVCEGARREVYTQKEIKHIEEGAYVNESGEILCELQIFNVPVGEERYITAILREKARLVGRVTHQYVEELEGGYPRICGQCCSSHCDIELHTS